MSPDSKCWLDQTTAAGQAYIRALLSNRRLPMRVRNDLGAAVLRVQVQAKAALMGQEPVFVPSHLDGAES